MLGSSNDVNTKTFSKISVGLTEFLLVQNMMVPTSLCFDGSIQFQQIVCYCTKFNHFFKTKLRIFLLSLSTKSFPLSDTFNTLSLSAMLKKRVRGDFGYQSITLILCGKSIQNGINVSSIPIFCRIMAIFRIWKMVE